MFSLIITIIAIALVAALALAAIYYGGTSLHKGSTRAAAVTLIAQSNQIAAAGALATADGVGWPTGTPAFPSKYLTAMPTPPNSSYVDGSQPKPSDWEYYMPEDASRHFVLRNKISRDVCMAVNHEMGMEGIPAAWDGTSMIQCFGSGESGAYTFFYDPPPGNPEQTEAALDQSLQEGDTDMPGYPRQCPDTSVIYDGVCSSDTVAPSGNDSEPAEDIGDGMTPILPIDELPGLPTTDDPPPDSTCSDMPWLDGCAPTETVPDEQYCLDNPSATECDASGYTALVVQGFPWTTTFTAVSDCSYANTQGNMCLPVFHSKLRTWQWAPADDTYRSTDAQATDGRLSWWNKNEYGFSIQDADGNHVYTISESNKYGTTYEYTFTTDYPSFVTKHGKMGIDCAVVKQDMIARRGFLQVNGEKCQTIEYTGVASWTVFYDYVWVGGDAILDTNPAYTVNWQNWGTYEAGRDIDNYHITIHARNGNSNEPLAVGAIGHDIDEREDMKVTQGIAGQWPFAPLETDLSNQGW